MRTLLRRRLDLFAIVGWPIAVALLALLVYPLVTALARTFLQGGGLDWEPLRHVLRDPAFSDAFTNTMIVIGVAGCGALLLASLFAWLNERTDARMGALSTIAPMIPLLMPPVAIAVGWVFLAEPTVGFLNGFARSGLELVGVEIVRGPLDIASWPGLVFVYTIALVPFAYVVIAPAFRNLDSALEEASRMCGAGPVRTAIKVSLPVIGPALLSGALLIVMVAASMYSIPAIIGSEARIRTLSVYIVNLTQASSAGLDRSVAASVVLMTFIGILWMLHQYVARRQHAVTISGKSSGGAIVRLGVWRPVARAIIIAYLLAVSVAPFFGLTVVALQPFWQAKIEPGSFTLDAVTSFFTSSTNTLPRQSLIRSLQLGVVGGTLVVLAATILLTQAQHANRLVGSVIRGATKVPAAISGLVIAVAVLYTFAGPPFSLKGSLLILLLAYLVMFMPQASIAVESARAQVGEELLEASAMTGSSRLRTSLRVLWPLMRPGLAYGWALIFVLILGDLIAASVLSGPGNQVVGAAIVSIYSGGTFSDLAVLSMVVTVTALAVVGPAIRWGRHRGQRRMRSDPRPARRRTVRRVTAPPDHAWSRR